MSNTTEGGIPETIIREIIRRKDKIIEELWTPYRPDCSVIVIIVINDIM